MRIDLLKKFDNDTLEVIDTAKSITDKYTKELDKCVEEIQGKLDTESELCESDLVHYITQIPILIYFLSSTMQELGIKKDTAVMQRRHIYDTSYLDQQCGTVAKKTSQAKIDSQDEQFIEDVYTRVYKACESKIDSATILYSSLKKILQLKMSEMELTKNNMLQS